MGPSSRMETCLGRFTLLSLARRMARPEESLS